MEYTGIQRGPDAFQQPVQPEQIISMCKRAFGEDAQPQSAQELDGGLYNTTYLIHMRDGRRVILRVSPSATRVSIHEGYLMRNEYASQPFLAPIAPFLPPILAADFTHQLIDRDYLFQVFMEGDRWDRVMAAFTAAENRLLWRQLGSITRSIHAVKGEAFGSFSSPRFPIWSGAFLTWLSDLAQDIQNAGLDADDLKTVLDIAQAHTTFLDEVTQPSLLHGDLWTVNILVKRGASGPKISAVLDSDRTSWGDPLSDWTIFLLHFNAPVEAAAFWETYGQPESSPGADFRKLVYQARYIGGARLEHHRHHHAESVKRSYRDIQRTIEALKKLIDE